jgi:hypothetical protein
MVSQNARLVNKDSAEDIPVCAICLDEFAEGDVLKVRFDFQLVFLLLFARLTLLCVIHRRCLADMLTMMCASVPGWRERAGSVRIAESMHCPMRDY